MRISRRSFAAAAVALAALVLGGTAAGTERSTTAKAGRMVVFVSCGELLGYAHPQTRPFVGPYGLTGRRPDVLATKAGAEAPSAATARDSAAPAPEQGVDFSGTNVQEEGVDEPDLVKTDGNTLFAVASGRLAAVDLRGGKPTLLDTLQLDAISSQELLLHGNRLLVISRGGYWAEPLPAMAARMTAYQPSTSVLTEVDVSNPAKLRVVRTLTLDGSYLSARMVGTTVRIVSSSQVPEVLPFVQPQTTAADAVAAATRRNRTVLESSKVGSWLPSYRIKRPGRAATKAKSL